MHLCVRWPQGQKETKCKGVPKSGRAAVCRKPPGLTRQTPGTYYNHVISCATPGTYYNHVIILYYSAQRALIISWCCNVLQGLTFKKEFRGWGISPSFLSSHVLLLRLPLQLCEGQVSWNTRASNVLLANGVASGMPFTASSLDSSRRVVEVKSEIGREREREESARASKWGSMKHGLFLTKNFHKNCNFWGDEGVCAVLAYACVLDTPV